MPTPASPTASSVVIDLGERSYAIAIGTGLIGQVATYADLPRASQALIVSNTTVAPLYAERVRAALTAPYPQVHVLSLPAGEAFKTWETLQLIFAALLGTG